MIVSKSLTQSFRMTALGFSIFALTFFLMQPATGLEGKMGDICVVSLGLVFWISLLTGVFSAFALRRKNRVLMSKITGVRYPGVPGGFRFFSNGKAALADVLFIASAVFLAIVFIIQPEQQYLFLMALGFFILGFSFHCLFNSDAYISIKALSNIEMCKERRRK